MASLVDFQNSLKFLKTSRSHISLLTRKADELVIHAPEVVDAIIEYMDKVESKKKMPALYLLDSIVKNVGSPYTDILKRHVTDAFCRMFKQSDKNIRRRMFDVRHSWNDMFPYKLMTALDHRVREMDPGWPVFQKSQRSCQESSPLTPSASSSSPAPSTVTGSPQDNSTDLPSFKLVYVGPEHSSWRPSWPCSANIESWIPRLPPPPQCDAAASCPTPESTPPGERFILDYYKFSSEELFLSGDSSDVSEPDTAGERRSRKRSRGESQSLPSKRQKKEVC